MEIGRAIALLYQPLYQPDSQRSNVNQPIGALGVPLRRHPILSIGTIREPSPDDGDCWCRVAERMDADLEIEYVSRSRFQVASRPIGTGGCETVCRKRRGETQATATRSFGGGHSRDGVLDDQAGGRLQAEAAGGFLEDVWGTPHSLYASCWAGSASSGNRPLLSLARLLIASQGRLAVDRQVSPTRDRRLTAAQKQPERNRQIQALGILPESHRRGSSRCKSAKVHRDLWSRRSS